MTTPDRSKAIGRRATNPFRNPAVAAELTMRERQALMNQDDWGDLIDVVLAPHREETR